MGKEVKEMIKRLKGYNLDFLPGLGFWKLIGILPEELTEEEFERLLREEED